jgi:hypothetical protein
MRLELNLEVYMESLSRLFWKITCGVILPSSNLASDNPPSPEGGNKET